MKSLLFFGLANCLILFSGFTANALDDICFAGKALPFDFLFEALDSGDIDGDGDIDVVVTPFDTTPGDPQVVIALNDGSGNFTESGSFGSSTDAKTQVVAVDVDGDTDLDLIVTNTASSGQSSSLAILLNNGDATFASQTTISGFPQIEFVGHHDLDSDLDVDLILISREQVTILTNQGDGSFAAPTTESHPGAFLEHVVFADLDSDQNIDFAVSNRLDGEVWIYSNMGNMVFAEPLEVSVGSSIGRLVPIDFDGDQDTDLAIEVPGNNLAILENDGNQAFTLGQPFQRFAAYDAIMYAEDYDFDNDLDIFDGISWHVNDGGTFQTRIDVITDIITIGFLADVDGDGDSDVLYRPFNTAGTTPLATLLNNGDGTHQVTTEYAATESTTAITTDLNGDAMPDLVFVARQQDSIVYRLNQGGGMFGPELSVNVGSAPSSVAAGDVDSDGVMDLVVSNSTSDNVTVLLQNGSGQFITAATIPAGDRPADIELEDLDGDGDVDLLVATRVSNATVGICLNNSGVFAPMQFLEEVDQTTGQEIEVADFDGDTDLDIVFSHRSNAILQYDLFVNDGNANFTSLPVATANTTTGKLYAADLDGDQNQDIIQARISGGVFSVMFGNGNGTFQSPVDVGDDFLARGSDVCDIDGDQDLDLIARLEGSVLIYENTNGNFGSPLWFGLSDDGGLVCADFNGDSKMDLLGHSRFSFFVSFQCDDVVPSVAISPTTATVEQGTLSSGSASDLIDSDNVDLSAFRNRTQVQPRVNIRVTGDSSIINPSSIEFSVESSVFARSKVEQTIELYNFTNETWDIVNVRNASRFVDATTTVSISTNAADYVQLGSGAVDARIRHRALSPRLVFTVNVDQVEWVINR